MSKDGSGENRGANQMTQLRLSTGNCTLAAPVPLQRRLIYSTVLTFTDTTSCCPSTTASAQGPQACEAYESQSRRLNKYYPNNHLDLIFHLGRPEVTRPLW